MATIILIALCLLVLVSFGIFIYEIKHAKEVDPKEPFIYGDLDCGDYS